MPNLAAGGLEMFRKRTTRSPRKFVAIGAALVALAVVAPASALPIGSSLADETAYSVDSGVYAVDAGLYETQTKDLPRAKPPAVHAPELKPALCGSFQGSIIWSSGATYDCTSGIYQPAAQQD
jgi:hypothetical protein